MRGWSYSPRVCDTLTLDMASLRSILLAKKSMGSLRACMSGCCKTYPVLLIVAVFTQQLPAAACPARPSPPPSSTCHWSPPRIWSPGTDWQSERWTPPPLLPDSPCSSVPRGSCTAPARTCRRQWSQHFCLNTAEFKVRSGSRDGSRDEQGAGGDHALDLPPLELIPPPPLAALLSWVRTRTRAFFIISWYYKWEGSGSPTWGSLSSPRCWAWPTRCKGCQTPPDQWRVPSVLKHSPNQLFYLLLQTQS